VGGSKQPLKLAVSTWLDPADPFRGDVRVLITWPQGFERSVTFATDEDPVVIAQQVRGTIDE
jgi:hypothetical protein